MEIYKFNGGNVSLIHGNILLIEYETGKLITVKNIFELKRLTTQLIGNEPFHSITDERHGIINLSNEAKAYLAEEDNEESQQHLSNAVIVNSLAKKIEAELYALFHKPKVKTKVFTDLNNALIWSEGIQNQNLEMA